jgi:hypothetical protein
MEEETEVKMKEWTAEALETVFNVKLGFVHQ